MSNDDVFLSIFNVARYILYRMIINASLLVGREFKFLEEGNITIANGLITKAESDFVRDGLNYSDYLILPSLINAHTHLGDSFAKEAVLGMDVDSAVGPKGRKWELYERASEEEILRGMRASAEYMLSTGITHFADFRESGEKGVRILKEALRGLDIRPIILGRNIEIAKCEGLGINVHELKQIPKSRGNKLIAIHAGENKGEIAKALDCDPDVIVHFTKATEEEIALAAKKHVSVVICPRSNAALKVGIPAVRELLDAGINVALGTDNVMINSPNLWREMEFLSKLSYLSKPITPREILQMATVNAAKIFNLNSGSIEKGKAANLIFLDKNAKNLQGSKDILAAVVHRCETENVRKVMLEGKFILDKNEVMG